MPLTALFLGLALVPGPISVGSLLPQMTDMSDLTHRPSPFYKEAQSSSYDRRSNPGPNSDPFANGDAGNFLRIDKTAHGNEYVMADLKGPGAVVRVWSANPAGTIRFYFDDESEPRLSAKMADLLQGKVAPFGEPFAYNAANGTNLYFPLPYAKSLRITDDESDGDGVKSLYYHVGYRTYSPGVSVESFRPSELRAPEIAALIAKIANDLTHPDQHWKPNYPQVDFELKPDMPWSRLVEGSGTVRELRIRIPFPLVQNIRAMSWADPHQAHNVLRQILFNVEVDGHPTISVPLGDFFATSPGLNPFQTLPFEVRADGTMICRFPMPYHEKIRFGLDNIGPIAVPVSVALQTDDSDVPEGTYALHAEWSVDHGSTRPMRDMNFLTATGPGIWVGSNLHVSNPVGAWWGEGDEKVYVDGENFPSTFGTGTEDYYGYAWSAPIVFMRPYHAQPRSDGPANFGHSLVERWHILDPIPFTTGFKFDLEMWHWADVDANYTHTAYWYAPAGSHHLKPIDRTLLLPRELKPPQPVAGAIEGEGMKILEKTGGVTEAQEGFWGLSAGKQLWWRDLHDGDRLVLSLPVAKAGRYEVVGNFCHARDYGIHKITINGTAVPPIDFYGTGVEWKQASLGEFDLPAGEVRFEVECVGKNPEALPARMFGLDYLLLKSKQHGQLK